MCVCVYVYVNVTAILRAAAEPRKLHTAKGWPLCIEIRALPG